MIALRNLWHGMYYFIKAVAITGADINDIRIEITLLFNQSLIINSVLVPDLALKGRSVTKSISISCQTR